MEQLLRLKAIWERAKIRAEWSASEAAIAEFEASRNVKLPNDFHSYFTLVNGMDEEVDSGFYEFYSLNKVDDIVNLIGNYGIPRHGESVAVIRSPRNCFVFADYSINLIAYAIRLSSDGSEPNEIYAICGGDHKVIANSFSEFLFLYLDDSDALMI